LLPTKNIYAETESVCSEPDFFMIFRDAITFKPPKKAPQEEPGKPAWCTIIAKPKHASWAGREHLLTKYDFSN
jgi:hypothetical protein